MLNRSKPSMPLAQVKEDVKEMKSVDEEDDSEDSPDGKASGLNLQDVADIVTPKTEEQNLQSFRETETKNESKPEAAAQE